MIRSPCLQGLFLFHEFDFLIVVERLPFACPLACRGAAGPDTALVASISPTVVPGYPMRISLQTSKGPLLFSLFAALTALIYAPGLYGGFVYDDWSSITGNANVHIVDGSWAEWIKAGISFPSGTPPFRSLTMVSFAANHFVGGPDPFGFKLANLSIHVLNGLLLFLALRALFQLSALVANQHPGTRPAFDPSVAAAALAGLWLLLPINLTAVLYVVQRLESLATLFIFLGLWWYLRSRLRHWRGEGGTPGLFLSLGLCTALSILCKEVGVMLPFYAFLVEFCLTGGRNRDGRRSVPVTVLYVLTLLLPLIVGMIWLWGRYIGPGTAGTSTYGLLRLMTEARVIVDYIVWTLLPSLDSLTLYHDDIVMSEGLLSPPSTLASILALAALLGAALWQRHRRPLFALGVLWFFAGHLLTGTVIPLILAFEHRNYFSSAGLLLGVAGLFVLEGGLQRIQGRLVVIGIASLLFSGTLWMRAQEWSDPLRLAHSEAAKRPQSPSAQYDYAQALIILGQRTAQSAPISAALKVLDEARKLPGSSTHFEQSMIGILAPSGIAVPADLWNSLIRKLRAHAPDTNAIHSLSRLNHCFMDKKCNSTDLPYLAEAYEAALSRPISNVGLLGVHGEYAWHVLGDRDIAEQDYREALRRHPRDIEAQMNLIVVLIHQGKLEEARAMTDAIDRNSYMGSLDAYVIPLRKALEARAITSSEPPEKKTEN